MIRKLYLFEVVFSVLPRSFPVSLAVFLVIFTVSLPIPFRVTVSVSLVAFLLSESHGALTLGYGNPCSDSRSGEDSEDDKPDPAARGLLARRDP